MEKIKFSVDINAPKEKVWRTLWDDATYRKWTSAFCETSYAETDWKEGSKVLFLDGNGSGMVSRIETNRPNEYMSIEHLGEVKNGVEDTESEKVKAWSGAHENYTLSGDNGTTKLHIDMDSADDFKDYLLKTWPKALEILKSLSEGKEELTFSKTINLPVEKVWEAWSVPETCKKWWGPTDFTCPHCSIDFREGGKYLSCMRSAQGDEFWSTGTYKEIVPFKKLVMTDSFSDAQGNVIPASQYNMPGDWPLELLVTVNFEDVDGKTKLTLHHAGLPPEAQKDCQIGWEQSFDKLEKNI